MSLRVYNRKRKFSKTPEPKGKTRKSGRGNLRFVVQMHEATRLHFDLRLEFGGVFKSWAVPKGPSLNPLDQRLAVFVEDHPLDYGSFEGIIPSGNYGAGTVMLWDEGTYVERGSKGRKDSEAAVQKAFAKGHITFVLTGHKLNGEFALIQLKKDKSGKAWLLVKKRDAHSTYKRAQVTEHISVKTGRTLEEIAAQSKKTGQVWEPRKTTSRKTTSRAKPNPEPRPTPRSEARRKTSAIPRRNKPMLATIAKNVVEGPEWIFEEALGGLRALAEVEGSRIHLYSKSGLPFEKKFPRVVEELRAQKSQMVLDGEIVKTGNSAVYHVYDLLFCDGRDLRDEPLKERKSVLAANLVGGKSVKLLPTLKSKTTGKTILAKNSESVYRAGTTKDWLQLPLIETKKKTTNSPSLSATDEVRLTNLDKIYWPDDGYTKGDLIAYYQSVASYILPYLKDRPESLNRFPNGIGAAGFYQKDMTGHLPRWLKTERVYSESVDKSVDYVLAQDERSLLYLVNLGCIEMNPWFSRVGHLDKPDFLVIDLDPDGNDFKHVIEIAHEVHTILDSVGASNYCKTSGATGIHIGVPTGARYEFEVVRKFAEDVCRIVAKKFPATTSVERNPSRRRGKIYLDFMQNRRGQTLASPFCVRPKRGAPVSMPLEWKHLTPKIRPEQFHIENALQRVQKFGDSWKPVLGKPVDLVKCAKILKKKYSDD